MELRPVIAFLLLIVWYTPTGASIIPAKRISHSEKEIFKLHITEKGTIFDERIEVDVANDMEYFEVPGHNDVPATDNLFDFRMNVSVSKIKDRRVCHITPLPPGLPRPTILREQLRKEANLPASHKIETIFQQWRAVEKVKKETLPRTIRDFCGQYPVYRLEPYSVDSAVVEREGLGDTAKEREKRSLPDIFDICGDIPPCHPTKWKLRCKFAYSNCVYYRTCHSPSGSKNWDCDKVPVHFRGTLLCCTAYCS